MSITYYFYGSRISKCSACCRIFQNDSSTAHEWNGAVFEIAISLHTYSWLLYILLWDETICILSPKKVLPWQEAWKSFKLCYIRNVLKLNGRCDRRSHVFGCFLIFAGSIVRKATMTQSAATFWGGLSKIHSQPNYFSFPCVFAF